MVSVSDIIRLLDQVPVWKRLRALPDRVDELEKRLAALEGRGKPGAATCPICGAGTLKATAVKPHPTFGDMGVQQHDMRWDACGHTEQRMVDPRKA